MTKPYNVTEPLLQRFHSYDAIMVAYPLKEARGVIRDLLWGGTREGERLVKQSGNCLAQINATGI